MTDVVFIASEKVTEILSLTWNSFLLLVGEVDETVGAVESITNEFIFNVALLPPMSVTVILQFE